MFFFSDLGKILVDQLLVIFKLLSDPVLGEHFFILVSQFMQNLIKDYNYKVMVPKAFAL